jgi:hypothetical protein
VRTLIVDWREIPTPKVASGTARGRSGAWTGRRVVRYRREAYGRSEQRKGRGMKVLRLGLLLVAVAVAVTAILVTGA